VPISELIQSVPAGDLTIAGEHTPGLDEEPIAPRSIQLHGHAVTYQCLGEGPPLVLIHGITSSSQTWNGVIKQLAKRHTVIAPDLLGHGKSAKPRGDYSLGAYASGIRDLLVALGHPHATIVGHSLGGGVAMQLAYQFPERVQRLVLVSSGGLGREVSILLRAATLPGAEFVLPVVLRREMMAVGELAARALERIGLRPSPDLRGIAEGFASLADTDACRAFLHTARAVLDLSGQRIDASDRLYLASDLPTLIVWGKRDPILPVSHAHTAHALMPHSRLEIFDRAGHFPFYENPMRFVETVEEFVDTTEPAKLDEEHVRRLLLKANDRKALP
jgi:pimeloyl-ACP methyl ester carboxylesterase